MSEENEGFEFDEFGNFIGAENSSRSSSSGSESDNVSMSSSSEHSQQEIPSQNQVETVESDEIVLYEDRQLYPAAEDVFKGAEVIYQEEDAQSISEPVLKPKKRNIFQTFEETKKELNYFEELSKIPERIRNLCLIGNLHHGKTEFCKFLQGKKSQKKGIFYRDDEESRKISLITKPFSTLSSTTFGKSYILNILDAPGHPDFGAEISAALRLSDGIGIVVDVVEGVSTNLKKMLCLAVEELQLGSFSEFFQPEKFSFCLILTKMDRLIHELKLPPKDAYVKIDYIIHDVNKALQEAFLEALDEVDFFLSGKERKKNGKKRVKKLSPKLNNVCFASSEHGWCFNLDQFASMYLEKDRSGLKVTSKQLSRALWGDIYFDSESKKFLKRSSGVRETKQIERTFVHFVLKPIYKLYSLVFSEEGKVLVEKLRKNGIKINVQQSKMDVKPLLKLVFGLFFQGKSGFMNSIATHIPSPEENHLRKLTTIQTMKVSDDLVKFSNKSPLVIQVVKSYGYEENSKFTLLGRVFNGSIKSNDSVLVLGERFRPSEDEEDLTSKKVSGLYLPFEGEQQLSVEEAFPGNLILLHGVDQTIRKFATLISKREHSDFICKPLIIPKNCNPIMKVGIEPLNPSELPQVIAGLNSLQKVFVSFETRAEESGEHVVLGTGELFLDTVLKDLREIFAQVEVKVSDPSVSFRETVGESSSVRNIISTANKKNNLGIISEPLDSSFINDFEGKQVDLSQKRRFSKYLETKYGWDVLESNNLWAFGPSASSGDNKNLYLFFVCNLRIESSTNIFLNDTLPSEIGETNEDLLTLPNIQSPIVQGFSWACREGPLCEEPLRGIKFKLLDADFSENMTDRSFGQLIPCSRRACYSSILSASPRLLEPVFLVEVQCHVEVVSSVDGVFKSRRGNVFRDEPIPGSPFWLLGGYIPVIDSFGFETDLRVHTKGLAFPMQFFDSWSVVPGDPLDENIIFKPLEPSRPVELAREFVLKTRRRKGLGDNIEASRYLS
eukprot:snap_masked-scaffold_16-processed-gene-6.82-mRNA-1 protein AED:0.04 eAED:0.07 QI:0/0/0/1/1/1/2/0/1007